MIYFFNTLWIWVIKLNVIQYLPNPILMAMSMLSKFIFFFIVLVAVSTIIAEYMLASAAH